jgi:hypothetical protein
VKPSVKRGDARKKGKKAINQSGFNSDARVFIISASWKLIDLFWPFACVTPCGSYAYAREAQGLFINNNDGSVSGEATYAAGISNPETPKTRDAQLRITSISLSLNPDNTCERTRDSNQ